MLHGMMRFIVLVSMLLALATLRGEEPIKDSALSEAKDSVLSQTPPLLAEAIKKSSLDSERWAYTQTTVSKDRAGQAKEELVVRFDPSLPYEEQWTPLTIDGRQPTARQIKQRRAEHEKRRQTRRALGELLNLTQATIAAETATTITYEVPLIKDDNQRLPPEKFRVTVDVNKAQQTLEHVGVRLRAALRMMVIFKLKSGEADLNFATVDPSFAPPIMALRAEGEGSVLFVKVGGNYTATRTDFKRVTPYQERFKVKLGEMKFIDY